MNKVLKIVLITLFCLFSLSFIITTIRLTTKRKNLEKDYLVINDKLNLNNQYHPNINKDVYNAKTEWNQDYMIMTEEDFGKLDITKRWIYRSKCLEKFHNFKNDYKKKNFIYPLPKPKQNGLIFVNLASYRDPECHKTIKSLIFNSSNWKNLRIVVCEQNAPEDLSCKHELDEKYHGLIRVLNLSFEDARGPTWARFLIQQQYSGEEYYLQVDSHTIFEKNWDTKLIHCLNRLPNKSCLTQYLPDYEIGSFTTKPKLRSNLKVSKICALDGFTRINAQYVDPDIKYDRPFLSNGWSGCFSFSRGDICYDAPIDCYTPDVFFGEEMDIALRLFTRGWNFYAPNFPIAYTNFNRNYRDTFWQKKGLGYDKNITLSSRLRIHYRLGTLPNYLKEKIEKEYPELLIEVDKFTLGNERTLRDYEKLIEFKYPEEK